MSNSPLSDFLRSYLTVAIFASLGFILVGLLLAISWLIRPDRYQPQKYISYESGVDPVGDMWSQSQVRYYVFALLFVIFDVEVVFLFPWATQVEAFGAFGDVDGLDRPFRTLNAPIHLRGSEARIRGRGPDHGEHTAEVLAEAGLTEAQIDELLERGVVLRHDS